MLPVLREEHSNHSNILYVFMQENILSRFRQREYRICKRTEWKLSTLKHWNHCNAKYNLNSLFMMLQTLIILAPTLMFYE